MKITSIALVIIEAVSVPLVSVALPALIVSVLLDQLLVAAGRFKAQSLLGLADFSHSSAQLEVKLPPPTQIRDRATQLAKS